MDAQRFTPKFLDPTNVEIRKIAQEVKPSGWLYIDPAKNILPGQLLREFKPALGLEERTSDFRVLSRQNDEWGMEHIKYQQYFKEVPIEHATVIEHVKEDRVKIFQGSIVELDTKVGAVPALTTKGALELAMEAIGATRYEWESEAADPADTEVEGAPLLPPTPELIFVQREYADVRGSNYYLGWKIEITTLEPEYHSFHAYVNASTGSVLLKSLERTTNGTAVLQFGYGSRQIDIEYRNPFFSPIYYHLRALSSGRNIHTKEFRPQTPDRNFDRIRDYKNNGLSWGADKSEMTTAHWTVTQAHDYFFQTHNRRGYDGNGMKTRVYANWNEQNARYQGGVKVLLFGSISDRAGEIILSELDIAGHEFTHGVIDHSSDLVYEFESGALNESFADIFGVLTEDFAGLQALDWTIGDNVRAGGIRNLANPNILNDPDTYLGTFWRNFPPGTIPVLNNDFGGVHTNSGVQNRWFSLLTDGGTHNGITVQGIGVSNAGRITYSNMTRFLQATSQYDDAREGAINAARNIFGDCSFEVIQTTNAWAAVGVGATFNGGCITLSGPRFECNQFIQFPLVYEAEVTTGATVTWDIPNAWGVTTTSGPGNRFLTVQSIFPYPSSFAEDVFVLTATSSAGGTESITLDIDDCIGGDDCPPGDIFCRTARAERMSDTPSLTREEYSESSKDDTFILSGAPNPTVNNFQLTFNADSAVTVTVYDATGRQIALQENVHSGYVFNVSDYPKGLYYVRATGDGIQAVTNFIRR